MHAPEEDRLVPPWPAGGAWGPPWAQPWHSGRQWWSGPPQGARVLGAVLLSVVQVLGTLGASQGQPDRRGVDALAVALLLAGPAVLLFGRRWPRVVPWAVVAITLTYLGLGYPYGPVFASLVIALGTTVVRGHRLTAWLAAGAVVLGDLLSRLVFDLDQWTWVSQAAVVAWVGVILAVAEIVRVRRERAVTAWQAARETRRRQAGEERLRIAQELHDVVAHHMSLINVQAGVALHLADRRPEQVEPALHAIKDASKEALTELRSLIDVLRDEDSSAPRGPAASLAAVDDIVDRSQHAGLRVTKHVAGQARPLTAAVELAAFRIVQEAITNVVRHAQARSAEIHLGYGPDMLTVRVDDDGRGGAPAVGTTEGSGIRGMEERARALGGELTVGASPLGGIRVESRLPIGAAT